MNLLAGNSLPNAAQEAVGLLCHPHNVAGSWSF